MLNYIKTIPLVLAALVLIGTVEAEAQITEESNSALNFQNEITVDYLKKHLSVFAADSMMGRETGMPGQKKAAQYLAGEYGKIGLKPVGDNDTYFQDFDLVANKNDSTVYNLFKTEDSVKTSVKRMTASKNSTADIVRLFGGYDTLEAEIVFAGFGVKDPTHNVDHLRGMDLKDKWVMVFRDLPHVVDGDTLIDPRVNSRSRFAAIMNANDARGMLLIPLMSSQEFEKRANQQSSFYENLSGMSLKYRNGGGAEGYSKGYNLISPDLAATILGVENADGLMKLREDLIKNVSDFSPEKTGFGLSHTPSIHQKVVQSENVAAYLEGNDPKLKDEVVVLTSHYDHLGVGQPDSTGDAIYNGADDDGSGTIALLNIAHALKQAKEAGVGPKRSILFLNVSGEEKGLLGSRYYSDHPIYPIDKTVTNINIDMIGRIDKEHKEKGISDYSYIIGSEIISSDLDSLVKVANRRSGQIKLDKKYNDLSDPNQFYRRSDHWNFGRLGVPFVFFFTGVHEDYHRPSDEVHKIRFEKLETIVKTIYATALTVANTENPPKVDNEQFIEITREN